MEIHNDECELAKKKVKTYTLALNNLGKTDEITISSMDVNILNNMTKEMQDACNVDAIEIFKNDENERRNLIHECVTKDNQDDAQQCIIETNNKHCFGITATFLNTLQIKMMEQNEKMKEIKETMDKVKKFKNNDNMNLYL